MSLTVDLYWSFRSPYSYLVTGRMVRLAADYDVTVNVRPVYPLAVRDPDFFKKVNPLFVSYLMMDIKRVGAYHGIPIRWPKPDPIVQDIETRRIAAEQPYIYRLTRLGVEAGKQGHALAFIDEVSRVIWTGDVEGWDTGDHLANAAARAGLDLAAMDRAIAADPEGYDAVIAENQKALEAAGHWGVPTMVVDGEPFFGQDRFDLLVWRLKQKGLAARR